MYRMTEKRKPIDEEIEVDNIRVGHYADFKFEISNSGSESQANTRQSST